MKSRKRILVDTGPIVAVLCAADAHHESCIKELRVIKEPLLTCWPVITEVAWLLGNQPKAISSLLASLNGENPVFELAPLDHTDLPSITSTLTKYSDLGLQLADACLVHLAGREGIQTVFTLDRRDFGLIRSAGSKTKLRIIP